MTMKYKKGTQVRVVKGDASFLAEALADVRQNDYTMLVAHFILGPDGKALRKEEDVRVDYTESAEIPPMRQGVSA